MNKEEMWDSLIEQGVSEQTLQIVTNINGFNEETMKDVLYAHTGYRDFDQEEETFTCPFCEDEFDDSEEYNEHLKEHDDD